jgi:hypothetical protein
VAGTARAQRFILIPEYGWGDQVVDRGELPLPARAFLRQQLQCEPRVAFLFGRCYVFRDGFDLWTWNGRFVLYEGGRYWELPREDLGRLLGPNAASTLAVPWGYRLPPGMATGLGLVAVVVCLVSYEKRRARRRASLMKDERYVEALQAYADRVSQVKLPSAGDRREFLAAGVERLTAAGVSRHRAEADLRLLVAAIERHQAHALRDEAHELADEGDWESAAANYRQAAVIMEAWDAKAAKFLHGRAEECLRELRREPD